MSELIRNLYNVLKFMMQSSIMPFLAILEKWVYYGILEDLHKEFFVEEISSSTFSQNSEMKYEENYWNDKYILVQKKVPCFYENIANKVFLTGKYVNVIKVYDPKKEFERNSNLSIDYVFTIHNDEIKAKVDRVFEEANMQLIRIVLKHEKFLSILGSIKKYFFMEFGDYFLNFMELAENELVKSSKLISIDKLVNFLEIAVKTSSANVDVYHENLSCALTNYSTSELIQAFHHYTSLKENKRVDFEGSLSGYQSSKKGYECLTLNYKIKWPLNLILTEQTLFKYQLLFRYLFHLKHPERQLSQTWQLFMEQRDISHHLLFRYALSTLQKMIHFNKSFIYHFLVNVVHRKWEEFIQAINTNVKTFEEIIEFHDAFIQSVFNDSLILDNKLKFEMHSLNNFSLFFCENMKNLIGDCVNYDYNNIMVS